MGDGPASGGAITAVRLRSLTDPEWRRILAGEPREAARWVRAAAEHGFSAGQIIWGQMLLDGHVVPRDASAAFGWFARAAASGAPEGINMVGRCHELGWGVSVDHAEAARHYRRAAERGSAWGAYNLGCMQLYGRGLENDAAEARAWFLRAAQAGHAKAMGLLGRIHEEGWGVPADAGLARRWYEAGAEGGDCWAGFNLARMLGPSERDRTLDLLRAAMGAGTPNFLRAAGAELLAHPDAAFQAIGHEALIRAGAAPGPSSAPNAAPSPEPHRAPALRLRRIGAELTSGSRKLLDRASWRSRVQRRLASSMPFPRTS